MSRYQLLVVDLSQISTTSVLAIEEARVKGLTCYVLNNSRGELAPYACDKSVEEIIAAQDNKRAVLLLTDREESVAAAHAHGVVTAYLAHDKSPYLISDYYLTNPWQIVFLLTEQSFLNQDESTLYSFVRELNTLAQCGLAYGHDENDIKRYSRMQQIAFELGAPLCSREGLEREWRKKAVYKNPQWEVRIVPFTEDGKALLTRNAQGVLTTLGDFCQEMDTTQEFAEQIIRDKGMADACNLRLIAVLNSNQHLPVPMLSGCLSAIFICEVSENYGLEAVDVKGETLPTLDGVMQKDELKMAYAAFSDHDFKTLVE